MPSQINSLPSAFYVLWSLALLTVPAGLQAAPIFSDIYVFGDSLSDTGNSQILVPGGDIPGTDFTYGENGRFSNGPVWVEYLNASLGMETPLVPSRAGGTNYAHGGASFDSKLGPETGLLVQYQSYMNGYGADGSDSDALYVVWAGSNDLREKVTPGSDPLAVINESMANFRSILSGLLANGAEHLFVPNIPNLGRAPEAINAGISTQATQLALLWNTILAGMLSELSAQTDATIYAFDAFGVLETVFANQEKLGFTNVSEPCSFMAGGEQVSCANPDEFFFWDILHPTTAVHELIGENAYQLVTSQQPPVAVPLPATLWLLLPGFAVLAIRQRRDSALVANS